MARTSLSSRPSPGAATTWMSGADQGSSSCRPMQPWRPGAAPPASSTSASRTRRWSTSGIRPRADAGDDYLAFTVRDSNGLPSVWLYGHGGRAGGQLPNERSTPSFLNSGTVFLIEEAACGANCGLGPATQPDGKTFTYSIASQTETVSTIASVLGVWPRPGQV